MQQLLVKRYNPSKIALTAVVWQNSLSRFCGLSCLSGCGSHLFCVIVAFAIRTDSRTRLDDEAPNSPLLINQKPPKNNP